MSIRYETVPILGEGDKKRTTDDGFYVGGRWPMMILS